MAVTDEKTRPLKVLIVGAGIGGLTAALAFRQQGHHVTVFEQSQLAGEVGAALHLAPNANGILRRLGLFAEKDGAVTMNGLINYNASGELGNIIDMKRHDRMWQYQWLLAHRVHLHSTLKEMALSTDGKGKPAVLKTASRITDIDPKTATVVLKSGESFSGDLVLGADGVHSVARTKIPGGDIKPFGSGKSAFRFLIPWQTLADDPITKDYVVGRQNKLSMWFGNDRRLVMYPCSFGTLMNFVAIHPTELSDVQSEEWNEGGSKSALIEVYKQFGSGVAGILEKVDPDSLKVWKLLDMDQLPSWVNDKLALLGDAAHPFLPHQGQGGGVAIEDAASLAVLMPFGTSPEEIPERLKLYEKVRYERAHKIQHFTRLAGRDLDVVAKSGEKLDNGQYTLYNFGHDEWDNSTQALRKWKWGQNRHLRWRQPIAFGPAPGPRQDIFGRAHPGSNSEYITHAIRFRTSRTLLQNLFPHPKFSFVSPGTVAEASWSIGTLKNMVWLGGGGYHHFGLYIHGVQYEKKDGTKLYGTFLAVLFESLADPIVTGREELGMPKVFCDIDVDERSASTYIRAGWRGATFAELEWENFVETTSEKKSAAPNGDHAPSGPPTGPPAGPPGAPPPPPDNGQFTYRYVPAVGKPGVADAEYAVWVPGDQRSVPGVDLKSMQAQKAKITFHDRDSSSLPTLHYITSRLAEIPVFSIVAATRREGRGVEDVSQAERIE